MAQKADEFIYKTDLKKKTDLIFLYDVAHKYMKFQLNYILTQILE